MAESVNTFPNGKEGITCVICSTLQFYFLSPGLSTKGSSRYTHVVMGQLHWEGDALFSNAYLALNLN